MQEGETSQTVYQKLMASSELQSLHKFKSYKAFNLTYPDALKYPEFFNNNLLSQGRVIKVVRGKSALIRAFCYQLMKLTFEFEVPDIDYVKIFKDIVFHPALLVEDSEMQSPSSGRTYTDRQYKRFLGEFIELMAQQSIPNFELTIMEYPIVEQALTRIMERIVERCFSGEEPDQTEELLEWLSKTFEIGMERYGKCFRFDQSDVFLYEESKEEFYIAYLSEMAEVSDYSESTYRLDGKRSKELKNSGERSESNFSPSPKRKSEDLDEFNLPIHSNDKYRYSAQLFNRRTDDTTTFRNTIDNNKSFIKELSRDMDESAHNDKPSDKHSKIGSLLDIMSDRSSKDLSQPYKTLEELSSGQLSEQERRLASERVMVSENSDQMTPQFPTNLYMREEDHYNPFMKKYSEKYLSQLYEKNQQFGYISDRQANNFIPSNPIVRELSYNFDSYSQPPGELYTKQGREPYHNDYDSLKPQVQRNSALIDSLQHFKPKQVEQDLFYKPKSRQRLVKPNQPLSNAKQSEDSRGTLYRQFTDTKVLEAMPSIERLKINLIRKKYRGKHRKDLLNIY